MQGKRLLVVGYLALLALNFLYVPWHAVQPSYWEQNFPANAWIWTVDRTGLSAPDLRVVGLRTCAILVFLPLLIMALKRKPRAIRPPVPPIVVTPTSVEENEAPPTHRSYLLTAHQPPHAVDRDWLRESA